MNVENKKINKKCISLGCYVIIYEKIKNVKIKCYVCSGCILYILNYHK